MDPAMSIGSVTVATNRYVEHWLRMARGADKHLFPGHRVVMHVFTDRATDVAAQTADFERVSVNAIAIDSLGWPDAALLAYELMSTHVDELEQDLLVNLDADMLFATDVGSDLSPESWSGGMALVRHPGYRRPAGADRARLYASHPGIGARDAYSELRYGGLGRWETDRVSTAFVPRRDRSTYVCGATWFGLRASFLAMANELASRTRHDLDAGRIAVWHDESHLNWFASRHATEILDSSYCYVDGLPGLADLDARILAVDKADDRTR